MVNRRDVFLLFTIPEKADFIIKKLNSCGFEAYLVGGAVRDILMGAIPYDTDITTNALPEEIKSVFCDFNVIETGIKHGTVTVLTDDIPVEVTTYRTEEGYSDGRHPDKVNFTSDIIKDLSRRDFTVNSIAYNNSSGFVDPYAGRIDIKNKIIRCVGNPKIRFEEDALRILRALRFASVLGFEIDKETSESLHECKLLLKNVSAERIYSEIAKMLCGKNIKAILTEYADVLSVPITEIGKMIDYNQKNFHHKYDLLRHTAEVVGNIPAEKHLRFAALLHDIAKPLCQSFDNEGTAHYYKHPSIGAHIANDIMLRLKVDNVTREKVVKLIKWHDTPIEESERIIKRKLRSVGEDLLFDLYELQRADTLGLADDYHNRLSHFEKLKSMTKEILLQEQCFSIKQLNLNGFDIAALGLKGKQIGNALNFALEAVIDGATENNKEALLKLITENADSF